MSNAALLLSYFISIGALRLRRLRGEPLLPRRWYVLSRNPLKTFETLADMSSWRTKGRWENGEVSSMTSRLSFWPSHFSSRSGRRIRLQQIRLHWQTSIGLSSCLRLLAFWLLCITSLAGGGSTSLRLVWSRRNSVGMRLYDTRRACKYSLNGKANDEFVHRNASPCQQLRKASSTRVRLEVLQNLRKFLQAHRLAQKHVTAAGVGLPLGLRAAQPCER